MRLALLQINPTAGDLEGNSSLIIRGARAAQQQGADLMVIDQQMPFLSGTELVKLLRERKAAIPLVMVTNHPQAKSDAMFAGLTYFVDKGDLQHQLTEFLPVLLPK